MYIYIIIKTQTNAGEHKRTTTMTTLNDLATAITTQNEFNIIGKQIWIMNFERLLRMKMTLAFSASKATEITLHHLELLKNANIK